MKPYLFILLSLFLLQVSCTTQMQEEYQSNSLVQKTVTRDSTPVEKLIEKNSQIFEFHSNETNVIQGENGTTIAIAKGSLLNADGSEYNGEVNLKLYEAIEAADMIKANLSTMAGDTLLKTGGMVYFDITDSAGNQLKVDPKKPGRVEIPTDKVEDGMMLYDGKVDSLGNINWVNPIPLEKFLTPVDIFSLNLLPPNFADSVKTLIKLDTLKSISKQVDSIYYTLSVFNPQKYADQLNRKLVESYNEAFTNKGAKVENWKYIDGSFETKKSSIEEYAIYFDNQLTGVNPAIIKVIKNERFNNTLIATHEFEERLQTLFYNHYRADNLIQLYMNNLDKNMWEIDEMILTELKKKRRNNKVSSSISKVSNSQNVDGVTDSTTVGYYTEYCIVKYEEFVKQKAGKVPITESAKALAKYYNQQLKKVTKEIDKTEQAIQKSIDDKNKQFDKEVKKYETLLFKREEYRFKKYGWEFTKTGWKNVDKPALNNITVTAVNKCGWQALNATVNDEYERVYVYAVLLDMRSLYRLNTLDNQQFYSGNETDRVFPYPCSQNIKMVMVGYKGDKIFYSEVSTTLPGSAIINFSGQEMSEKELNRKLKKIEFKKENDIHKDLEFQAKNYENVLMNKKHKQGIKVKFKLYDVAFPRFFTTGQYQPVIDESYDNK